jgi:hypothetical protein
MENLDVVAAQYIFTITRLPTIFSTMMSDINELLIPICFCAVQAPSRIMQRNGHNIKQYVYPIYYENQASPASCNTLSIPLSSSQATCKVRQHLGMSNITKIRTVLYNVIIVYEMLNKMHHNSIM